jgi:hypothetical protein
LVSLFGDELPSGGSIARGLFAYTENAGVKNLDMTVNLDSTFVINPIAAQQVQFFGTVVAAAINTAFTNINVSGGGLDVDASFTDGPALGGIVGMLLEGNSMTGCSYERRCKSLRRRQYRRIGRQR